MRNSEIQKKKPGSLFTPTNLNTTNLAEMQKQELENEVTKVGNLLTHEYTSVPRVFSRESESTFEEEKILKKNFNKLRADNLIKEKKIAGLIDLINCYSMISPKNGISLQSLLNNPQTDDEAECLKLQIEKEEEKIVEEENSTEILIDTKNKVIKSTLI